MFSPPPVTVYIPFAASHSPFPAYAAPTPPTSLCPSKIPTAFASSGVLAAFPCPHTPTTATKQRKATIAPHQIFSPHSLALSLEGVALSIREGPLEAISSMGATGVAASAPTLSPSRNWALAPEDVVFLS